MKTPRTDQESKMAPRTGVAVVEAAFAAGLETELHEMSITLARIAECGGIGDEGMYDNARELLTRHADRRNIALAAAEMENWRKKSMKTNKEVVAR